MPTLTPPAPHKAAWDCEKMLTIENLEKRFGDTRAVDGLNIRIHEGEMVGIIGRSGAGKSTLLRLLNRLIDPTQGSVRFGDVDVTSLKGAEVRKWRANCAMIFQQFNLVGRLDVLTNVLMGRLSYRPLSDTLLKRFTDEDRARAVQALQNLDMLDYAFQRADTLSGGQQQRVAIARAIVQQPQFVLADEPIASLDPRNATKVMDALKAFNEEQGITVISNLHTLDTARNYCARVIGMLEGKVVFDGSPDELTTDMVHRIYGIDEAEEQLNEAVTSTSVGAAARKPVAEPAIA